MTRRSLLTVALVIEADIITARQRARQIAALLGFDAQDQTRIATAVSEIARNAATYGGGGRVEFAVEDAAQPSLRIDVRDRGPGIADVAAVLAGRSTIASGMGLGIVGTRRLMDGFEIDTAPGAGTNVALSKLLPRGAPAPDAAALSSIGRTLAMSGAADALTEVRTQNQELLRSLDELTLKQDETARLNRELAETNRGVVALYAELDEKAAQLAALNAELEMRVAAAVAECQQVNDALRQSQKMEAVGQLTGGIAHDFNNLLQIVCGNLEMIGRRLGPDDRLRRATDNAMSGAQRAATLTQRLLAFSRRQPLAPKPIDPNRQVEGMSELMRRTLGETVTIRTRLSDGLWIVLADANQLENALLNLAVNARDAMVPGGVLTITTANETIGPDVADGEVVPGDYVSIAVMDDGIGMSEATQARVLEPFFTTKEVGKGTGLGLPMVYGFVRQSGGHLRIRSELDRGTVVTLYLPRFAGDFAPEEQNRPAGAERARPGESILVVEDDVDVRSYTCDVLRELGYRVTAVADGDGAVEALEGGERIDLVFTDVMLAGALSGRDVARHAAAVRPGTPVLFASGYPRESLDDPGELLAKPFSYAALAAKVRLCLQG